MGKWRERYVALRWEAEKDAQKEIEKAEKAAQREVEKIAKAERA